MKIWKWFCTLGKAAPTKKIAYWQERKEKKAAPSGTEICTRMCGYNSCRCGGTMRGLYCVWSYYRE